MLNKDPRLYRSALDSEAFREAVCASQGKCCLISGRFPTQSHHILPYKSKDDAYNSYRTDPMNGINLWIPIHSFVTSTGSLHYVKFFFDFLDYKLNTDHSSFPIPDVPQLNLLDCLNSEQFSSRYLDTSIQSHFKLSQVRGLRR